MKQMTNSITKRRSLGLLTWHLFFYIIMFTIGVSWALEAIGFSNIMSAAVASQLAIFFLFLALFNYEVPLIKEITSFKLNKEDVLLALKITAVFLILNIVAFQASNFLFPEVAEELTKGNTEKVVATKNLFMMIILPIIVAPFVEELAFRAGFKRLLMDEAGWSSTFYVIVSSLVFGLLHFQPDLSGILTVGATFSIGAINALVYLKTNNIMIPILSHLTYNFLVIISAVAL